MIPVIIPIYNKPEFTQTCLDSLSLTNHGEIISPILINNNSIIKTTKILSEWTSKQYPSTINPKIINSGQNKGFAGACNLGIKQCSNSKYICIMHNDCVPFDSWLSEMLKVIEDDEVGIVIPRTSCSMEQTPVIPEIQEIFLKYKLSNKDKISTDEINNIIEKCCSNDRQAFVASLKEKYVLPTTYSPEISSFCMLIKTELFNKYGMFEECFWPRFWEDKFWFRQIERDGYVCQIANHAFVFHWQGATSDGNGFSLPDLFKINEEKYKQKCIEFDSNWHKRFENQ